MVPITRTELADRFPCIGPEIDRVESWFDVPLRYRLRRDPASDHFPPVADAFGAFTNDASARRIASIMAMARPMANVPCSGAWPVFLYAEDGFLLEGWHRLAAFRMMGMEEIDVVLVERDAPVIDPAGFASGEVKVTGQWCLSARWRGWQIGHLRLNRETEMPGGGRHVESTFVLPAFRRRGVARRLYDAAETFLRGEGLRLVPSPASALSTGAAALWANRPAT